MIETSLRGIELALETAPSLFSPRRIDPGTLAMLSCVELGAGDHVVDLGCGYGVVGILAAKLIGADRVVMIDNDPVAIEVAKRNAVRNGVADVTIVLSDAFDALDATGFSHVLCNPPYHVDFAVPKRFIEKGFNRLRIGGAFWLVAQRASWYRNKLRATFGDVREHEIGRYRVFSAVKRSQRYARRAKAQRHGTRSHR